VFTNVINPRSEVSRRNEYQPTLVRRGATIGANATILCGATIGEYAFIGAGAVVRGDVPAYALMLGVPARRVGWMCRCGVRLDVRAGTATCSACGLAYAEESGRLVLRP
jgi:UDP-2-acetamido-3-amino-2,3-dideoxy-glucuronate N-acetyltransferase